MPETDCNNHNRDCVNKECLTKLRKNDVHEGSKKVLELLSSKPLSYNEVVEQSGLNSRYAWHYLKYLEASKQINRIPQESMGTRGRPRVLYSISSNTNQPQPKHSPNSEVGKRLNPQNKLPSTVAVEVEFEKLQKACKYEKGRNCKQKVGQKCAISKCPLVLHTRLVR